MKYLIIALLLALSPAVADAGLLFGHKTVIVHQYAAPQGYSVVRESPAVTRTKHKERHRHGKHSSKTTVKESR